VRLERNADSVMVARVEEHRIDLPGVSVEVEPVRRYPSDSLAAHVLGYIGEATEKELERFADVRPGSMLGKTGIELQYESVLRGVDGIRYVEVNALGRRSEAFNREQPVPPRPGRDVQLSLDIDLQRATEKALDEAGYDGGGERPEVRGAAILMDVWSGEVLAMASRPGFDVNLFSRSISQEEWEALTREGHPLLNRAIQAAYPPGSVFKPVTEYAALAEGIVRPSQMLSPCFGGHRFGNRIFHCWKRAGHGSLESVGALANSCDVFFYQLAPPLGVNGIARHANRFRIADLTGIDLPRERKGLIPDSDYYDKRLGKKKWGPGVALNLVIGQGEIQLTPIQLVQNIAVFATDGRRVRPRLLKGIGEAAPAPGQERPAPSFPALPIEPEYEEIRLEPAALREVQRGSWPRWRRAPRERPA
jgi:penicillin-binding protein 2